MIISTKQQLVYPSCVCLVSPTVPSAPSLASTPTVTATTITISGSVPDDGSVVTGFVVTWQRYTCPDYGSITVTLSSLTGYTLTGLEEGHTYNITVAATNTAGSGPVSNAVITMTTETGKALSISPHGKLVGSIISLSAQLPVVLQPHSHWALSRLTVSLYSGELCPVSTEMERSQATHLLQGA